MLKEKNMKSINYKKILVTHDGSNLASQAIPHVVALAQAFQAEILLLRVVNSVSQELTQRSPSNTPPIPTLYEAIIDIVKENKLVAKNQLVQIKKELENQGIKQVAIAVGEGLAQDVILNTAGTKNYDLIVMSTHGRSGFGRALLGSITDHVVRNAQCPVLVVRPKNNVGESFAV